MDYPVERPRSQSLAGMSIWSGPTEEASEKEEEKDPLGDIIKDLEGRTNYDNLAGLIQKDFWIYKGSRLIQEQIAIRAHQNCKGVYPADMQFDGTSRAFVCATRPKVQTMVGVIMPIINPPGSNAWTVSPDGDMIDRELVKQLLAAGAPPDVIAQKVKERSEKACDSITSHIVDGLSDTEYATKLVDVVWDAAMYGTGYMRGPLAVPTGYTFDPSLATVTQQDEWRPDIEPIPFFEGYPDPGAKRREDLTAFIRRRVTNKAQMRKLLKDETFNHEAVQDIITSFPNGNWTPEWWEAIINITNSQPQLSAPNGRYIILEKWGFVNGRELFDAGFTDIKEELWDEQVVANIWVCGHRVIKLKVSELYTECIPVYTVPWSKNPNSIFGVGIPEMMFDSQDAINATERAKMDNLAMSSGPLLEVNEDRLQPGQDILAIQPRMVIRTRESEIPSNDPAVRATLIPNNVQIIQAVQDRAFMWADEQTSVPRFLAGGGGEGVHNRTLGGASLQFNAAMNPTKAIVFNFENNLIIPMIEDMVRFYKKFSRDPLISGDFKVDTKSVQGIMAREVILQQIGTFLGIMSQNPDMAKRLDYDRVGEIITRYMGLVDAKLVLPDSVVQEREQKAAENQANIERENMQFQAKIKAEPGPKEAALTLLQQAPEGSHVKLAMWGEVATAYGFMSEPVEAALEQDEAAYHMAGQAAEAERSALIEPNAAPPGVMPTGYPGEEDRVSTTSGRR